MSFKIIGTGRCVPERIVTNDDLAQFLDTSDEWISQRVGIKQRHVCTTESVYDLAVTAAKNALDNSGITAEDIDLIIGATVSADMTCPSVACMVQRGIGADCMAYDVNAACSAFLFMLETAEGYIARGKAKRVLVVGAERMSRIVDWRDRSTCVIFGDGAGAVVLEAADSTYVSRFTVHGGDEVIHIANSKGNSPFFELDYGEPYTFMNGQETFKFAVNSICSDMTAVLEEAGITADDVKYVVPHQANMRIIDLACRKMKLEADKVYMNIDRYGNTSSASIPMALDEMNRGGMLSRGDTLLFTAFGGGLASASCIIKW